MKKKHKKTEKIHSKTWTVSSRREDQWAWRWWVKMAWELGVHRLRPLMSGLEEFKRGEEAQKLSKEQWLQDSQIWKPQWTQNLRSPMLVKQTQPPTSPPSHSVMQKSKTQGRTWNRKEKKVPAQRQGKFYYGDKWIFIRSLIGHKGGR